MLIGARVQAEQSALIVGPNGQVLSEYVEDGEYRAFSVTEMRATSAKSKKGASRTLRIELRIDRTAYSEVSVLHQYFQNGTSFAILVGDYYYLPVSGFPGTEESFTRYTVRSITSIGEETRMLEGSFSKLTGIVLECDVAGVEVVQGSDPWKAEASEASDEATKAAIEERLIREAVREELAEPSASAAPATSGSQ